MPPAHLRKGFASQKGEDIAGLVADDTSASYRQVGQGVEKVACVIIAVMTVGCPSGDDSAVDAAVNNDVSVPETLATCPAESPLRCSGVCVVQDDTHCASCTDVCGPGLTCQFGQCLCTQPGQTTCNGRCVDVATDPTNCGACAHDCLGGGCDGGGCTPVVAASVQSPWGVVSDGTTIYFSIDLPGDAGAVMTAPARGGSPSMLASGRASPKDLALAGGSLYWTEAGDGTSWRVVAAASLDGGVSTVFSGPGSPLGLTKDETGTLYWIANDAMGNHTVWSGAPDQQQMTSLDVGAGTLGGLAAFGVSVFWTFPVANSVIWWDVQRHLGTELPSVSSPGWLAATGTDVYVVSNPPGLPGRVVDESLGTGGQSLLAASLAGPKGIAADTTGVYVTDPAAGTVARIALDGGAPTTLASGQNDPWNVYFDDAAIYWTNFDDAGAVMKLAK